MLCSQMYNSIKRTSKSKVHIVFVNNVVAVGVSKQIVYAIIKHVWIKRKPYSGQNTSNMTKKKIEAIKNFSEQI